jgi:dipeptidyl aminopeptidase/acylaminoacyl peptidase
MPNGFSPVANDESLITLLVSALMLLFCLSYVVTPSDAQQTKKSFTVADEIGLTLFGNPNGGKADVHFSPDGKYFAVTTERGLLEINRIEDSLQFYRSQDVEHFVDHSDESQPSPVWRITRTGKKGGIIGNWRWVTDSSGVAFLVRTPHGNQRLFLADLRKKTVYPLTTTTEAVTDFDVHGKQQYVYVATDPVEEKKVQEKMQVEREASVIVDTGRSLYELLFPDDPQGRQLPPHGYLWAVVDGRRFEVKQNGKPISPNGGLALSPDSGSLVTTLPVAEIPLSWETLYPPPLVAWPIGDRQHYAIHSGRQDLQQGRSVHQYVRINLQTGGIQSLTDGPYGNDVGWWSNGPPSWLSDGRAILLPGTFLKSKDERPSRPCVAVVDVFSKLGTCVEVLKEHPEEDFHVVAGARFEGGDRRRVLISFHRPQDGGIETTEYLQTVDGAWHVVRRVKGEGEIGHDGLEAAVKESFNDPPLLIATEKQVSRVIWDPNPQLKNIELGEASIYTWKDKGGKEWRGGLYKPSNYKAGRRYPLVIQTHGFTEGEFRPSGVFPTAFAARALAATGIIVLQTAAGANCPILTPDEAPCAVAMMESAANKLVSDGLVDPERIGIIGFSRSCFYVMETLTAGSLHLKAASITDGVLADYLQYMLFDVGSEFDPLIGARPFGEGLQKWLKRSPGFNLDKMTAPLLVVGEGPGSLLSMWQPYAGLHDLKKPVDLMMLNTDEHVLTNPAVRMASQGGSVDWFRFWLKDEEDSDPAKAEQYKRWRELRKMQEANDNNLTTR